MEPKTKQSLLVTVVGVTLFVALLRLSDVLVFAAKLIDLVLPILAVVTGLTGAVILLLFLSGLIMVGLGIIGYYLGNIYMEIQDRPRFIVSETCGVRKKS